jgi:hypothetical protein
VVAHQVAADDMRVDAAWDVEAAHLASIAARAEDQFGRQGAVVDDVLVVIHVVQEEIDGAHALFEAALDRVPLLGAQHARHQVEGHDLLDALGALIQSEGDAARLKRELGGLLAGSDFGWAKGGQQRSEGAVVGSDGASRLEHLVPERRRIVGRNLMRSLSSS